jgi:16S rRNA (cytidine1402-2'-O)-methyltransferase
VHEEVVRGDLSELAAVFASREVKGEVVVLAGPPGTPAQLEIDAEAVRAAVRSRVESGMSRRDAIRAVAAESGLPRNEVYRLTLR